MSNLIEIKVPDIGDYKDVPVIEVHVKPGDVIEKEQSIVTLESDKATMDIPSSHAGIVREVKVKVGDSIAEGTVVILLDTSNAQASDAKIITPIEIDRPLVSNNVSTLVEVRVPDIGDYKGIPIIEIQVKVGDLVVKEQSLITLESDKATMDIPSPASGVVKEIKVSLGGLVSEGDIILVLESSGSDSVRVPEEGSTSLQMPNEIVQTVPIVPITAKQTIEASVANVVSTTASGSSHASPSVRKYARELGVDISRVKGTGQKGRITQLDVQSFVKGVMSGESQSPAASTQNSSGLNLLPWPKIDFKKFGNIETKPLSRIKKISAQNLSRNWVMIPAVTYHEDADITELEAFRVKTNKENEKQGIKVTMLAFLIKAVVKALQKYPEFNSSLDGDNLVLKKYFNIGFAADTPNGLMVPVIKDADKKGIVEIAQETGELAKLAREGKLKPDQMQGACFTISSLGGIGGTYFAPIINAPEVAILGVNKAAIKPVWDGKQFIPKLICPLSLTADHRVIDGALATRFNVYLSEILSDFRRVVL